MTWTYAEYTHHTHTTLGGVHASETPKGSAKPGTTVKSHSFHDEDTMLEVHDNRNSLDPHVRLVYHIKPNGPRGYSTHAFVIRSGEPLDVSSKGPGAKDSRIEVREKILEILSNSDGHVRPAQLKNVTAFFRKHTKNLQP